MRKIGELEEEDKEHMVNGFGDRRDMSHTKGGNFYESGCINTNCLSGKVAKGATENIAKLELAASTLPTQKPRMSNMILIFQLAIHILNLMQSFIKILIPHRIESPSPYLLPFFPPRDSFELNTMVGQAIIWASVCH